ncbi:hypothetical protein LF1_32510 [Rubripirellula obstinata]|uniref:Uncharacterized protein n=1 Tax=Rubripirellula obstinata TaxID=406547 RepID=A0A5B1CMD0_9BACT|nr:hypothetical protein LF1_32510 [Rubripirellula obstinata]
MTKPDLPTMAILITAASFAGFTVWLGVAGFSWRGD